MKLFCFEQHAHHANKRPHDDVRPPFETDVETDDKQVLEDASPPCEADEHTTG